MEVSNILSNKIKVSVLAIFSGAIVFGVLPPILRTGMYTGSNKILLSINPLLYLLPFILLISGIICCLKNN